MWGRGRRSHVLAGALAVVLGWSSAAEAKWLKAETDRFIVYGEGREQQIRDLAVRLSVFDAVLRKTNPPTTRSSPRKLEVYLVNGSPELRRIAPSLVNIAGFYSAGSGGVFAVADRGGNADGVLFHEYAHAFMLENFPAAYPAWFVEGWAEYFANATVSPTKAQIGDFDPNTAAWLFSTPWLPWEVIVSKSTWEIEDKDRPIYYAQAWLLMHYMRGDSARAEQLNKATFAIAAGQEPVKALEEATGQSLGQLSRELRLYKKLTVFVLPDPLPNPPEVKISEMPPSADDFLLYGLRLTRDSADPTDAAALADIRRRAARWPGDRMAELTLARAEFVYGDVAAGEAAVKRRLDQEPNDVEALYVAGAGQLQAGSRKIGDPVARYKAARPYLLKAYALDKEDHRILLAYAVSRSVDEGFPNDNDVKALLNARALAPTVQSTSIMAGQVLLQRDRRPEALAVLSIVANNPHGGGAARRARALIEGKAEGAAAGEGAP